MSEVKDRHTCGECAKFMKSLWVCRKEKTLGGTTNITEKLVDPDDEACSDFEPRGGWQE